MTTNTHAEIARQAIAAVQNQGYDIQFGHCACTALVDAIAAAVQAAERRAVERCAQAVEHLASQRLLVCPRHDVSFPVFERQAEILLDAANMLRALDAAEGKK